MKVFKKVVVLSVRLHNLKEEVLLRIFTLLRNIVLQFASLLEIISSLNPNSNTMFQNQSNSTFSTY